MQLSNVKRIVVEDFKQDDREVVAKLAYILNSFMDEVTDLSRKNVSYDNLNRSKVTVDVTVDAQGKPMGLSQINTNLKTYSGNVIINTQSLKSGTANVVSAPYLDCTPQGNGIVKINAFYGLPANAKVKVTIEFIG